MTNIQSASGGSNVLNIEYWPATSLVERIWNLPFDLAQGGELVEPFVIWVL
jgi:hypothetical protein